MQRHVTSALETWLLKEYGGLIDSATTAKVLGYRNVNALAKARSRGALAVPMVRIPNRRGWWTTPQALAGYLAGLESKSALSAMKARAMDG